MCGPFGGKDDSAKKAAEAAAQKERERQARIAQGTASIDQAFAGFNDDYYTGLTDAYSAYAQPKLQDDFSTAKKNLNFALARKGLSASTSGADQYKKLEQQFNDYMTDVANAALNYSRNAQKDVENSRSTLLGQLTATEDPAAAAEAAARSAELFTRPPTFDPLGTFAFDFATGLQAADAAGGYQGLAKSPLFSGGGRTSTTYVT